MAVEIFDKGICKAAGSVTTAALGADARVSMLGVASAVIESVSSILLTLDDPISQEEFLALGQLIGADGQVKITWVSATTVRVETRNSAGAAGISGRASVAIFRLARAAQISNVSITP